MSFTVIIPARYPSSRLPGKPLADIGGKPMIQHVYERALQSGAAEVIIATDDQRIADEVERFGGRSMLTSSEHQSGTERLAEVVEQLALSEDQVVVNVQGDEPFIPPEIIRQVADNLANQRVAPMATLAVPMATSDEVFNPNAVKVVCDSAGYALYFSRAPIPYNREQFKSLNDQQPEQVDGYMRHIGIYAYRADFIKRYVAWNESPLERIESLEQLRVLWHGEKIHVAEAIMPPAAGIDTPEDLEQARQRIK
ncbi:3-deoxy-manno-octulosonate cytidylyltransferase [Idiomarina baltica]|uniref:3-deoxy-manno-octulosonate cytidylyltransferase n=2 Tax=Idiomarina baltica TaxID=190892 RepID=A0A348WNW4_9GAMM|nr:3-deoxy-manno-octulosonate cytidylyltransferase [Idiomarina baltica]EAQ32710.1 3-deoxy-manno-octulosonate cytidylyltransferase [Idiomarina baltica OS145]MBL74876.1 3-deoxy-manno-octulosonate cytidylyltransferase [Idiomarinaceae bacterium]MEC8926282.1 3-deoxy-manno-octulosonate cytidylyltransferase [Pseudomonadota bacterium]HAR56226.1 3-deoxy-manno-octulosonate cytidylyltransferase [Idiomarina baltica]|tara:strand:- start:681 stop:1439 length:759 start_codon:yes stop_codon:yes gene_type:complete